MSWDSLMLTALASNSSSTGTVTLSLATTTATNRYITWIAGGGATTGTITVNEGGSVIFKTIVFANSGDFFRFSSPIRTAGSNTASIVTAMGNASYINCGVAYV